MNNNRKRERKKNRSEKKHDEIFFKLTRIPKQINRNTHTHTREECLLCAERDT